MGSRIDDLLARIRELENEMARQYERELQTLRGRLDYTIERGRVRFREAAISTQKPLKKGLYHYLVDSQLLCILTSPVIYALLLPLVFLDLFVTVYQWICFPVYKISKVRRGDYLVVDRHHLAYLNLVEKVNCVYCGYGNGVLAYALEVASRTEAYWCPIKHATTPKDPHSRYHGFSDYGDARAYRKYQDNRQESHYRR